MRKQFAFFLVPVLLLFIPFLSNGFQIARVCQNGNNVTIQWRSLTDTCNSFKFYTIHWKENENGNFEVVDTLKQASRNSYVYNPPNTNNVREWEYFIKGHRNCPNDTLAFTDTVSVDKEGPDIISLDSISVVNEKIVLGWPQHPSQEVRGYTIYYVDGGQTRQIDTINGRNNTLYIDSLVGNPGQGAENFRIGAFDSCYNSSPISVDVHSTIHLSYSQDSCEGTLTFNWTEYQGWNVGKYSIFASKNGSSYQEIKTVSGNTLNTEVTTLESGNDYEVFVRAYQEGNTKVSSSSNVVEFSSAGVGDPGYVYIREVTVKDSNVHVNWFLEKESSLRQFEIYRGESLTDMSLYRTVPYTGGTQYIFVDSQIDVSEESMYYQVKAVDVCDNEVGESNKARNIVLDVRRKEEGFQLDWNAYREFDGDVQEYRVFRKIRDQDNNTWQNVGQVSYDVLSFFNVNNIETYPEDGVCFRVEAVEGFNNQYGYRGSAYSNVECIYNDPIVFVPNAFIPSGVNNTFKPKGTFVNFEESSMKIYNRWGAIIFETDDLTTGWNGRINGNGKPAPAGVYIYFIEVTGVNQSQKTYKGDLHLLR